MGHSAVRQTYPGLHLYKSTKKSRHRTGCNSQKIKKCQKKQAKVQLNVD